MSFTLPSLLVAIGFSLIHLISKKVTFSNIPVHKFSSFVGGISISYVFFHLLPVLSNYEHEIVEEFHLSSSLTAYYLIFGSVLAGLVAFYLLENYALIAKKNKETQDPNSVHSGVFWAHIGSYFVYNGIIGALLTEQGFNSMVSALFYLMAVGLHFMTNDWVLRHHFPKPYDKYGRKLLIFAVLFGWFMGSIFHLNHVAIALLEAFVAGGMTLNAIKDELPSGSERSMRSFLIGIVGYSFILFFL